METEYDFLFKIVLIGDAGVGKTSIVRRYTDGIFTSAGIPTIGVDFCIKTLQIGNSAVKVNDTLTHSQTYVRTHTHTHTHTHLMKLVRWKYCLSVWKYAFRLGMQRL